MISTATMPGRVLLIDLKIYISQVLTGVTYWLRCTTLKGERKMLNKDLVEYHCKELPLLPVATGCEGSLFVSAGKLMLRALKTL